MVNIMDMYNIYNFKTRFSAFIFLVAPIMIQVYLMFPELSELTTSIIVLVIFYVTSNLVSIYIRFAGGKVVKTCFPDLMPAQEFLHPKNNELDKKTKERYYRFFEKKIDDFTVSCDEIEIRKNISTAILWLKSKTRDRKSYELIFEENINFGLSFNLLGIKYYGIAICIIMTLINLYLIKKYEYVHIDSHYMMLVFFIIFDLIYLSMWIFLVTKKLVKKTGNKYAYALLSACDSEGLNN